MKSLMQMNETISNFDAVLVESFELDASIGVFDWEKKILQKLVFDLTLYCDFSAASQSDEIEDAIDYVAVCSMIEETTLAQHYQLLEALADKLANKILINFPIKSLLLSIRKPGAVPKAKQVGVQVYRHSARSRPNSAESF